MRWTSALRQMVSDVTLGSVRARVVLEAGVDALHVDAGVLVRAVAVTVAADRTAELHEEVPNEAGAAATLGHMVHNVTFLVRTAR